MWENSIDPYGQLNNSWNWGGGSSKKTTNLLEFEWDNCIFNKTIPEILNYFFF